LKSARIVCAVAFCALIGFLANASDDPTNDFALQWTQDLRPYGYAEPSEKQFAYSGLRNSVAFLGNDTLAVSFFSLNPNAGLTTRGKVFGGRYLFQTVFFDAKSGKVLRTQQWSDASIRCRVFPAPNGAFVVWADLELSLHSSDGTRLKTLALDPKDFPRGPWVKSSPSGKTLFAAESDRTGEHVLCIRAEDLRALGWLDLKGCFAYAPSDSLVACVMNGQGILPPADILIRSIASSGPESDVWKRIYTTPRPGCDSVTFLDEHTLSVSGFCHELTILSTSGEVLFQRRFEHELTSPVTSCWNCDLVLTGTVVWTHGMPALDIPATTKSQSRIFLNRATRRLIESPFKHVRASAKDTYAASSILSPDGCLYASQFNWGVQMFDVCHSPLGVRLGVTSQK
jgi:hypothetical protein